MALRFVSKGIKAILSLIRINSCFQGLFYKLYSSGIPIDNNQEELDLVTEVANPLLPHFCSFFLP